MKIFLNAPCALGLNNEFYDVVSLDYSSYDFQRPPYYSIINRGLSIFSRTSLLLNPGYIQHLYQEKDAEYMRFLDDFYQIASGCEAIVLNPGIDLVHPEFLSRYFKAQVKCLHHIDDPHLTYNFSTPFAWAFDCASYISKTYNEDLLMKQFLANIGLSNSFWLPLTHFSGSDLSESTILQSWQSRKAHSIYIGNEYSSKSRHISQLRYLLGNQFKIYGSYKFFGLPFAFSNFDYLWRHPILPNRISNRERTSFYLSSTVGFNIHISYPRRRECGNARTYELAAHGVAQVVDNVGISEHPIFTQNEVLTYQDINEAAEIIQYLLNHPSKAQEYGLAAYSRFHSTYSPVRIYSKFFNWLSSFKN